MRLPPKTQIVGRRGGDGASRSTSKVKVSELHALAGTWVRENGSRMVVSSYRSERGRFYPRASVTVCLWCAKGLDLGCHTVQVAQLRLLIEMQGYTKVAEETP
jgi:hypothetical protein